MQAPRAYTEHHWKDWAIYISIAGREQQQSIARWWQAQGLVCINVAVRHAILAAGYFHSPPPYVVGCPWTKQKTKTKQRQLVTKQQQQQQQQVHNKAFYCNPCTSFFITEILTLHCRPVWIGHDACSGKFHTCIWCDNSTSYAGIKLGSCMWQLKLFYSVFRAIN